MKPNFAERLVEICGGNNDMCRQALNVVVDAYNHGEYKAYEAMAFELGMFLPSDEQTKLPGDVLADNVLNEIQSLRAKTSVATKSVDEQELTKRLMDRSDCRENMLAWAREWWKKSPQHVECKLSMPSMKYWRSPNKTWSEAWVPTVAAEVLDQVKKENA